MCRILGLGITVQRSGCCAEVVGFRGFFGDLRLGFGFWGSPTEWFHLETVLF